MRNIKHRRTAIIFYAPILAFAMVIMTARLFAYAAFLDTAEFGRLSIGFLVSSTFGMLAGFGSYIELQRQLPILYRLNKRARGLASIINSLILNAIILATSFLFIPLLYYAPSVDAGDDLTSILALGAFNGYLQQAFLTLSSESKSKLHLLRYASLNLMRSICVIVPGVAVARAFGSAQLILVVELISTMAIGLWMLWRQLNDKHVTLRRLITISIAGLCGNRLSVLFTLSLLSLASTMSVNVDRWVGAYLLDVPTFGQFSFALTIVLSALYLQSIINASAFPIFSMLYVEKGRKACWRSVTAFSLGLLVFSLAASAAADALLLNLIPVYFPKYVNITNYCWILLIAASFRVAEYFSSYLVISGNERSSLISSIASVVFSVAATLVLYTTWNEGDMEMLMAVLTTILSISYFLMQLAASYLSLLTDQGNKAR